MSSIFRWFIDRQKEKKNVRDEYGGEQIRVGPLHEQAAHQLAKIGEVDVSLWTHALEPVPVRPVRVEEEAEEERVEQQALAPRPLVDGDDGDVAVQTGLFRPVVVPLSDRLDFDHHARDVPGEGWQDRVSALAVGYTCVFVRPVVSTFCECHAQGQGDVTFEVAVDLHEPLRLLIRVRKH